MSCATVYEVYTNAESCWPIPSNTDNSDESEQRLDNVPLGHNKMGLCPN